MKTETASKQLQQVMSTDELADLGAENVAYIRPISSNEVMAKFPVVEGLQPGQMLWALFAANGDPLALSDERSGLLTNAYDLELHPVALH